MDYPAVPQQVCRLTGECLVRSVSIRVLSRTTFHCCSQSPGIAPSHPAPRERAGCHYRICEEYGCANTELQPGRSPAPDGCTGCFHTRRLARIYETDGRMA